MLGQNPQPEFCARQSHGGHRVVDDLERLSGGGPVRRTSIALKFRTRIAACFTDIIKPRPLHSYQYEHMFTLFTLSSQGVNDTLSGDGYWGPGLMYAWQPWSGPEVRGSASGWGRVPTHSLTEREGPAAAYKKRVDFETRGLSRACAPVSTREFASPLRALRSRTTTQVWALRRAANPVGIRAHHAIRRGWLEDAARWLRRPGLGLGCASYATRISRPQPP